MRRDPDGLPADRGASAVRNAFAGSPPTAGAALALIGGARLRALAEQRR
jgi:hypothetical protein